MAALLFVGGRTSQVAKPHLQKYCPGMSTVRKSFSNMSFVKPASLLLLVSTTTRETIRGSKTWMTSGMGKMTFPWKYGAYLPIPSLSYSSRLFFLTFQEAGVVVGHLSIGLCPGGIGLADGSVSFRDGEAGRSGQSEFLIAYSFGLLGGTFVADWEEVCSAAPSGRPLEEEGSSKSSWEPFIEDVKGGDSDDPSMVVRDNQDGGW